MATRAVYRQDTQTKIGPFLQLTAGTSTTSTLVVTTYQVRSNIDQSDLFKDYYIYRPDAVLASDRVRTVDSYEPSSGTLVPSLTWSNAPTGEAVELSVMNPDDVHLWINRALKRMLVQVEFTVTPTANAVRHNLTATASWLTDPDWVYQVGYLVSGEVRDEVDPYMDARIVRGEVRKISGAVYLEHTGRSFTSTETLYVLALRPASTYCKAAGGTYGDLTSGLTAETDEAIPEPEWVKYGAIVEYWEDATQQFSPGDQDRVDREQAKAAALFSRATREYFQEPERKTRPLLKHFGPRIGGLVFRR